MAYAFDKINEALQGNGSDIFSGGFGLSSDTSGDIGGGTPTQGGSTPPPTQQQTSAAQKGAFKANVGKVKSPVDTGAIRSQIGGMGANLQNEANAYVKSATEPYTKNVPSEHAIQTWARTGDVNRGLEPYPEQTTDFTFENYNRPKYEAPADWYQLATTNPVAPSALNFKTGTDIKDIGLLGTDKGVQELFRRQGGEDYTPGMGAFDASLLRGSGQFAADASDVLSGYGALQKQKSDIAEAAPGAANLAANYAKSDWMDALNKNAYSALDSMTKQQEAEAGGPKAFTDYTTQGGAIKDRLISENPDLASYLSTLPDEAFNNMITAATDPGTAGSTNWKDYLDQGEAAGFNRIAGLLKSGDIYTAGDSGRKDTSLNWDKLKQSIGAERSKGIFDNLPKPPWEPDGKSGGGAPAPGSDEWVPVEGKDPTPTKEPWYGQAVKEVLTANPYSPTVLQPQIEVGKEFLDQTMPWSPTNVDRTNKLLGGVADAYTNPAAIAPQFPSITSMLGGGGKSSTAEGKVPTSMIAGQVQNPLDMMNAPVSGPTYSTAAPIPIVPNTPTVDFGGGYGSANAGEAGKPPRKKQAVKFMGKTIYI